MAGVNQGTAAGTHSVNFRALSSVLGEAMEKTGGTDEKAEVAHKVNVSRQAGSEGSFSHQAVCSCGWKGSRWIRWALAIEDVKAHVKEYAD